MGILGLPSIRTPQELDSPVTFLGRNRSPQGSRGQPTWCEGDLVVVYRCSLLSCLYRFTSLSDVCCNRSKRLWHETRPRYLGRCGRSPQSPGYRLRCPEVFLQAGGSMKATNCSHCWSGPWSAWLAPTVSAVSSAVKLRRHPLVFGHHRPYCLDRRSPRLVVTNTAALSSSGCFAALMLLSYCIVV